MVEERWHDFAKEKPSEDMEGRNFIVSNGHYEKIATWCGYWENEPFMGDRLCDEVVRWKFYFTPEEEKANDETRTEPKAMKCDELEEYYYYEDRVVTPATHMYRVYHADKVDAAIAELKARIQLDDDEMAGFLQLEEECGGGDLRKYIAELKQKLEDVQASAYADSIDSGMENYMLSKALWLARAERASDKARIFYFAETCGVKLNINGYSVKEKGHARMCTARDWRITWLKVERKCLKKAEEYK